MLQCPVALRVDKGVEVRVGFGQQFRCGKAVEAQKPVGLIEAVFPEKGLKGRFQRLKKEKEAAKRS